MSLHIQSAARLCIPEERIEIFKDEKRLKAEQVKFLRPISGYALRDHLQNDAVRDLLGVVDMLGRRE
jgi:hypothetical protein